MMNNGFGTIVQIGDCLISEDVILEYFACDYAACKGCCCVEGDSGAPLDESELEGLERGYARYCPHMTSKGRETVDSKGFFEIDREGDIVTPVVGESGECAFCHFAGDGSVWCSIEKCGLVKPASCRLYPIRVTPLTGGGKALNLHRWGICRAAYEKGKKEGVRVYQFLREPLVQCYGKDFYEALCAAAEHVIAQNSPDATE